MSLRATWGSTHTHTSHWRFSPHRRGPKRILVRVHGWDSRAHERPGRWHLVNSCQTRIWQFVCFGWTSITSEYLGRHLWAERVAAVLTVEDVLPPKLAFKSNLNFSALLVAPPLWWTPQNRKRESSAHSVLDVLSSQVLWNFLTFKVARKRLLESCGLA